MAERSGDSRSLAKRPSHIATHNVDFAARTPAYGIVTLTAEPLLTSGGNVSG